MIRIVVAVLAVGLLTGLGLLVVTLLEGDATTAPPLAPSPRAGRGEAAGPPRTAGEHAAPAAPGAPTTAAKSRRSGPPMPPAAAPPAAARPVLRVARLTVRTESTAPPARPAVLPRPPLPPLKQERPYRCELLVDGIRPLHVECWVGSPWGTRKFLPVATGPDLHRFQLVDPWADKGPRILHIPLERRPYRYVDRFLAGGERRAKIRIGPPGEITGRLVGAEGRGIHGWVRADGQWAETDSAGRFRLRQVHSGNAVVYASSSDQRHAVRRAILACPGGPHQIAMEPGAALCLQIEGLPSGEPLEPPVRACAVTGTWPNARKDFAAETSYDRTTRTGKLRFGPVPTRWRGLVAIFHPRLATRFVSVGDVTAVQPPVRVEPRTVLLGTVMDARTGRVPDTKIEVTTSGDSCTLLDLARERKILRKPSAARTYPSPFLGRPLVEIDRAPASAHAFEIHADPGLKRLAVRVEAEGYFAQVRADIPLGGGVRNLVFRLQRLTPQADASIVLTLPAAATGRWDDLEVEGAVASRAHVDARRGEVRFTGLRPGLYWFKLENVAEVAPLQVDVAEGDSRKLRFPE